MRNEYESQNESENNDSDLRKAAMENGNGIEDLIVKNIEKTSSLMEKMHEDLEDKRQEANVEQFSELEKSCNRRNEYMKIHRNNANIGQARSSWSTDEIEESDI